MTKLKKLTALMLSVITITAASLSAMAALPPAGYVPTYGEKYLQQDEKWVPAGTIKASYKKDGKCTSFSNADAKGELKQSVKYTWSGNYITKSDSNYRDSGTTRYKYDKKHRLVYRTLGSSKYVYKWSGRTGVWKKGDYKETVTYNKKGQLTKVAYGKSVYKYTYYKNGNLKKIVSDFSTTKYNKQGNISSYSYSPFSVKASFSYQKDSNGRIKQVNVSYTDNSGKHKAKIVYEKWMKVSHVRNCDTAGTGTTDYIMTDLLMLGLLFR